MRPRPPRRPSARRRTRRPRPRPREPIPAILVGAFEAEGDPALAPSLARGFARHLVIGSTRFTDLVVFGHETSLAYGEREPIKRPELDVDFVLREHMSRDVRTPWHASS